MSDHPRTGRGARGILIAQATVLGLLVLLIALALRARPEAGAGAAHERPGGPPPAHALARPAPPAGGRTAAALAAGVALPAPAARAAAAPARAPDEPDEDGEREHYARFLSLLAEDRGALERAAPSILLGEAPVCERVGLLRALEDGGSPQATRLLDLALSSGPPASRSGPVQDFALRRLARRAPEDPAARAALRAAVWGRAASPDGALRRRAAAHLAATATEDELAAGFPELRVESDALVVQAFEGALAERMHPTSSSQ